MAVNTLTIDGKDIAIEAGTSILDAAKEAGVPIPKLCHLEGVHPVGACRLCLVEIEGMNKMLPACVTDVWEGMVIHTQTPKLQEYRRMAVELIFAEGNHVCSICVANGNCELQDVAIEVGMDHSRFPTASPIAAWISPILCLALTTTAVSSAPAASVFATRSRVPTFGMWAIAGQTASLSPGWINPGARWKPAPPVVNV